MIKGDTDRSTGTDVDVDHGTNDNVDIDMEVEDENDVGLPVDKGWSWAVLAGATLAVFLYGGMVKSYGVFFVEFQKRFESSASETNVMQTTHYIMVSISGVLVPNLGLKYMSHRTTVAMGGVGLFSAYLISAFATDIRVMTLTIGVISGTCHMMVFLPMVAAIGIYFREYRGLANSIHVSGSSIGSLVFGPFYTKLFEYYGYTGTMMLTAAILFNSLISAMLLRPMKFYSGKLNYKYRKGKVKRANDTVNGSSKIALPEVLLSEDELTNFENDSGNNCKVMDESDRNSNRVQTKMGSIQNSEVREYLLPKPHTNIKPENHKIPKLSPLMNKPHFIQRSTSHDPENPGNFLNGSHPSPLLNRFIQQNIQRHRSRTVSDISHVSAISNVLQSLNHSRVALYSSTDVMSELASVGHLNDKEISSRNGIGSSENHSVESAASTREDSCIKQVFSILGSIFDVSVFDLVFIHFLLMAGLAMTGPIMMNFYLIPYVKEVGATNNDISIIFIVSSVVDLISRVLTGFLADRAWLRPTTIVGLACCVLSLLCQFIRYLHSFSSLVIISVIQGAFNGTYMCLYNVILIEHVGLEKFPRCIGFNAMCHGISIAVSFQLTGLLRDVSGDYYYTYHLIGGILMLGGLLSFTLPMTSSFVENRKSRVPSPK